MCNLYQLLLYQTDANDLIHEHVHHKNLLLDENKVYKLYF